MHFINILVSLCISTWVILGAFHWHDIVKRVWIKNETAKIDQEIKPVLFQYLQHDIQTAGYQGCRTGDKSYPLYKIYSDYTVDYRYFRLDQSLFSFLAKPGNCFGRMPKTACERIVENTPVLILYNVPKGLTQLKYPLKRMTDPIVTRDLPHIQEKSLILISDCQQADLFIVTAIEGSVLHHKKLLGINLSDEVSKLYGTNDKVAEIVELQTVAYYLGNPEYSQEKSIPKKITKKQSASSTAHNSLKSLEASPSYALYRDDFLHPAQEIVRGIKNLEFAFGVVQEKEDIVAKSSVEHVKDETNPFLIYKKSEEIQHWEEVRSVLVCITTETGKKWQLHITPRNRHGVTDRHVRVDSHYGFFNPPYFKWHFPREMEYAAVELYGKNGANRNRGRET